MEEDGAQQRELEELQQGAAAKQQDFETRKKARLTAGGGGDGDQGARLQTAVMRSKSAAASLVCCLAANGWAVCVLWCSQPTSSPSVCYPSTHACAPPAPALQSDGSRRAFYKEFRRVVEASDVVIQVSAVRAVPCCACCACCLLCAVASGSAIPLPHATYNAAI